MLLKYTDNNKIFRFTLENERKDDQNVFTILVGKNGTGKSRLLSGIVNETLGVKLTSRNFNPRFISRLSDEVSDKLDYDQVPEKIIAISTSPFDKFPLLRRNNTHSRYSYLGLRDLRTHNYALAYLSKIAYELVSSVAWNPEQMGRIGEVLNYLGYTGKISLRFENQISASFLNKFLNEDDPVEGFKKVYDSSAIMLYRGIRSFFLNEDGEVVAEKVANLKNILSVGGKYLTKRKLEMVLGDRGISVGPDFILLDDFLFLFEAGFFSLREFELTQVTTGEIFPINDASSGEQSVVLSLLGIASNITNGSLICIDEPEICLHPEWQERYINILISTFRNYKNCHFIIATHSPQIISNLASSNCYILSVEDRVLISADKVNHKSIDYQLANVFKAPGFKNEYLSRIGLQTFAKVSRFKRFDEDDKTNLSLLKSLMPFLKVNDPIALIVSSLIKLSERYA